MATILFSSDKSDRPLALELVQRLKALGHGVTWDGYPVAIAGDWRLRQEQGLRSSDAFVALLSEAAAKSPEFLSAADMARAYAREWGRIAIIPVVIDEIPLPLSLRDFLAIDQPDKSVDAIATRIEAAISAFVGHRAAMDAAAAKTAEKIHSNAAGYIGVAMDSLEKLEWRDRWLGYLWYSLGFASLVVGIGFTLWSLSVASQHTSIYTEGLLIVALKAAIVIGLLGACAKYAFSLGKSYASEALKCADRMHAIRFGEFYLRAFGDKSKWEELKEVFQHWNIDRSSSFSALDVSAIDPKLVESIIELAKLLSLKKGGK